MQHDYGVEAGVDYPGSLTPQRKIIDVPTIGAVPFERTRRITGYLVGTMSRWGDAKRKEEADRVKHGITHIYNRPGEIKKEASPD